MTRYAKYTKRYNPAEQTGDGSSRVGKAEHNTRMIQLRKKVCLKCRRRGHALTDCPLNTAPAVTTCYKCNGSDHSSKACPLGPSAPHTYASCFVCHTAGHLASACPQNPNGLYPNGGGCRFCGSVKHYVKDCDVRRGGVVQSNDGLGVPAEDGVVDLQAVDQAKKASAKDKAKVVKF